LKDKTREKDKKAKKTGQGDGLFVYSIWSYYINKSPESHRQKVRPLVLELSCKNLFFVYPKK